MSFDPFSAANTASDGSLYFLLNPQRANRLVLQKSLDDKQLALEDVFNKLIESSFKVKYEDPYLNEIQHQINFNVLKYIMNLAVNNQSYFQVKAIANTTINKISKVIFNKNKPVDYAIQYQKIINNFKEHPEKFQLESSPKIPDGSPIGMVICNYNPN